MGQAGLTLSSIIQPTPPSASRRTTGAGRPSTTPSTLSTGLTITCSTLSTGQQSLAFLSRQAYIPMLSPLNRSHSFLSTGQQSRYQ